MRDIPGRACLKGKARGQKKTLVSRSGSPGEVNVPAYGPSGWVQHQPERECCQPTCLVDCSEPSVRQPPAETSGAAFRGSFSPRTGRPMNPPFGPASPPFPPDGGHAGTCVNVVGPGLPLRWECRAAPFGFCVRPWGGRGFHAGWSHRRGCALPDVVSAGAPVDCRVAFESAVGGRGGAGVSTLESQ